MLPPPPFIINWPNNWDRLRTLQKDQFSYAEVSLFLEKRWIWIRCGEKKKQEKIFYFWHFLTFSFFPFNGIQHQMGEEIFHFSQQPSALVLPGSKQDLPLVDGGGSWPQFPAKLLTWLIKKTLKEVCAGDSSFITREGFLFLRFLFLCSSKIHWVITWLNLKISPRKTKSLPIVNVAFQLLRQRQS